MEPAATTKGSQDELDGKAGWRELVDIEPDLVEEEMSGECDWRSVLRRRGDEWSEGAWESMAKAQDEYPPSAALKLFLNTSHLPIDPQLQAFVATFSFRATVLDNLLFLSPTRSWVHHRKGRKISTSSVQELCVYLPPSLRQDALRSAHCSELGGHYSVERTLEKLERYATYENLRGDVVYLCRACGVCNGRLPKIRAGIPELQPVPPPSRPFQLICMDIIKISHHGDCNGFKLALCIEDVLTKYVVSRPMRNQEATTVLAALVDMFMQVGIAEVVYSDNGVQFTSKLACGLAEKFGYVHRFSCAFSPVGQIERAQKEILARLASSSYAASNWSELLQIAVYAINTSAHRAISSTSRPLSPFEAMFGRKPRVPLDSMLSSLSFSLSDSEDWLGSLQQHFASSWCQIKNSILEYQKAMKVMADKKRKGSQIKVGSWVLLCRKSKAGIAAPKLSRVFEGPFVVEVIFSNVAYIRVKDKQQKVHLKNLRLAPEELLDAKITVSGDKRMPIVIPHIYDAAGQRLVFSSRVRKEEGEQEGGSRGLNLGAHTSAEVEAESGSKVGV